MLVANSQRDKPIDHNYLPQQFADMEVIWGKIREVVRRGDFTLGQALHQFECQAAEAIGVKHVIGVNSGTNALILTMKALTLCRQVIVPAFTFVASVASVVLAGCKPVLVDVGPDFNMDPDKIEAAITNDTEAIMPVHWAGRPCNMDAIDKLARSYGLFVIEDACHAIGASYRGVKCGALGTAAAFSLHPLKNVNVWGDGGFIATNFDALAGRLRLSRNHGLAGRNYSMVYGHNSRLDTIQAVVASHVLTKLDDTVAMRRCNAGLLSAELADVPEIYSIPPDSDTYMTYYLYTAHAKHRDGLAAYLNLNGVDAKIHYPVPQHMQPAAARLGYKWGDFPGAEDCADTTISLPVHEFVTEADVSYMAELIRTFYENGCKGHG